MILHLYQKKVSPLYVIKDAKKEFQYSTKMKNILLIHSPAELIFGIQ